jgi:glycosyltransferase involved in cell wall biosynthesis
MRTRRALVCAYTTPAPDRDSGSRRVYDVIEVLREARWAVRFVAAKVLGDPRYVRLLHRRGVRVHDGSKSSLEEALTREKVDLAVLAYWPVAEQYTSLIRRLSPATRVVVDSIDLHFVREARRAFQGTADGGSAGTLDAKYAARMAGEVNAYAAADVVLALSRKEADLVNDLTGDPTLAHLVPLGEDLPLSPVPFEQRKGMVFVGSFQHAPNVQAVEYLCKEVLPRVDPDVTARHPVYVIGNALNETVRRYAHGLPSVRMVGWVPSVAPYLERAAVSVVPLLYGAGVKGKLIQALMVGTPSVSTSVGVEGLNLRDGEHVLVADSPASFADAIGRLLTDGQVWHHLAVNGRARALGEHGREVFARRLLEVVELALGKEPKAAPAAGPAGPLPHPASKEDAYKQLVARVRDVVRSHLPAGATVLVVSRGDDELLRLDGRTGWHFPQDEGGGYAGYYPADSAAAVSHLEAMRARGARYLLFPATGLWWLEHYAGLREHLGRHYRELVRQEDACVLFDLQGPGCDLGGNGAVMLVTGRAGANGQVDVAPARQVAREEVAGPAGVRLIAFYLPQFHPIPENDAWWGRGFTEWTNVTKARPLFPGHYQPHLPADQGFYDLRLPEVREAQAALAREYGIYGFCYYHYWFRGKRLLGRPFDEVLRTGRPDFPFCLCWANEPWSRRWDGRPHEVLQEQTYSADDDLAHVRWLLPALADRRAIRVEGKPVFLVYQARDLPDPARTVETWRREVERAGLPGVFLLAVETGWDAGWDAVQVGFDAKVLFQPQFSLLRTVVQVPADPEGLRVFDYQKAWPVLANPPPVSYRRYHTVFPSWDNTPRRGSAGWVLHNCTPEAYESWLRQALRDAARQPADHRIVFINAWNEWGEGCHLEPDQHHGRAYLEATGRCLVSRLSLGQR